LPQDDTKKNLQKALEDSFASLENLDIQHTVWDFRALEVIEEEQMQLWDRLSQLKEYVLEKLVKIMMKVVINQDQEGIDFILHKFGYDQDNNTLSKSIYEIYKSLTHLEDEEITQDKLYNEIKQKLEDDEIMIKQKQLKEQIALQVADFSNSLKQFDTYFQNFSNNPTPEEYEKDLLESLKSSRWNLDHSEQFIAQQAQQKILTYRDMRGSKQQKLDTLRTDLLQWWKKIEKVSFAQQEERAQEIIIDLESTSTDVEHPLTNEDCLNAIHQLEQRAKDIVQLRQELKLNSRLDLDLTSPDHMWKISRPYMVQAYKIHADLLAKQQHLTLWVDVDYVSDLTPYIKQELQNISSDDLEIFNNLLAEKDYHHFDAGYAHPHQSKTLFLIHKNREVLKRIWKLNQFVPEGNKELAHIQRLLMDFSGTKHPHKKFSLLHTADYVLDLANHKTIAVKWNKFYEMQWKMPEDEVSIDQLYKKYMNIELKPITANHELYADLWDPRSKLTQTIYDKQSNKKYNDKLSIEQQYDILWQDKLCLYNIEDHKIFGTSSTPSSWIVIADTLYKSGWWKYLTSEWENIFEKSFAENKKFIDFKARVRDDWWYIIDRDGENVLWDKFEEIGEFAEWCLAVKSDKGRRFVDESGQDAIDFDDYIQDIKDKKFAEWYAVIRVSGRRSYIDRQWNTIVDSDWERQSYFFAYPFSDWLAVVKEEINGRYHIIDRQGKKVFGKDFFDVGSPHRFEKWFLEVQLKKRWDIKKIDKNGKISARD